ncbi:hypothetical protein J1N35_037325 [Gossypium stocksii]|uniref:Uncharacterized protein n=1 Tax=Gossypium stocksii TaxID=47602 RepID=A0A9D3UJZ3_9ROSI|nr:hypothetical protein J1N35_037325 [Gossypium stocksii]
MDQPNAIPVCYYELPTTPRISWPNKNPGRNFFGCKNYRYSYGFRNIYCYFFNWFDHPISLRARAVAIGLLRRIRSKEMEKRRERMRWFFGSVAIVIMVCIMK